MKKYLKFNVFFSAIFLFVFVASAQKTKTQPNIIFIVADDLGWGDVGFNGQKKIKTPNIDKLADEGIVMNNFYAGSTVCGPSRASLLTGKHIGHCSVRGNPRWTSSGKPVDISDSDITIAEELKKEGYTTGIIGKWGLAENLDEGKPNKQGFEYFYGFNKHRPAHHHYPDSIWVNDKLVKIEGNNYKKKEKHFVQDLFTKKAEEFIKNNEKEPFFLYLAYSTPHYELTVPNEYKEQYKDQNWPLREMKPRHYLHDKNGHVTYAGMVSHLDLQVGKINKLLEELNLDENTLVIFTSDNGHEYDNLNNEFFDSNGPYKGKKRDLYEGGIKVPFVAKWPKNIKKGEESDHISAFWDILPTFCDIANTTVSGETDGISFKNTMVGQNEKQQKHKYLYWEFNESKGPTQALRVGKWKAVKRFQKPIQIFDLEKDEGEKNNLANQNPKIVKMMNDTFLTARTENPNFPLIKLR